jgi:hypothetical protein
LRLKVGVSHTALNVAMLRTAAAPTNRFLGKKLTTRLLDVGSVFSLIASAAAWTLGFALLQTCLLGTVSVVALRLDMETL